MIRPFLALALFACDGDPDCGSPGTAELCNGVDEDCDGAIDEPEDLAAGEGADVFADLDADGFGAGAASLACSAGEGQAMADGDCDDADATAHPGATEVCGAADLDCDGAPGDDDPDSPPEGTFYPDGDEDGYGADGPGRVGCGPRDGEADVDGDCADADATRHPDAGERCDGRDDDCDGATDAGDTVYYQDLDGDGHGDPRATASCLAAGWAASDDDCDDQLADVSPGRPEVCNYVDDDCNGLVDDADPAVDGSTGRWFFPDGDADGFGDGPGIQRCALPPGSAVDLGDCDDGDRHVHPLAWEDCDGFDNDCDNLVDSDDELPVWANGGYRYDLDRDGYGGLVVPLDCVPPDPPPAPLVLVGGDCDDGDPDRSAADLDGDGFSSCAECSPADGTQYPGALDLCDGDDGDCDSHPDLASQAGSAGCDLCPSGAVDPTVLRIDTWNPCLLDPGVSHLCDPLTDTHQTGAALHTVVRRTDLPELRAPLFLWMGDAAESDTLLSIAAGAGYRVISLGYDTTLQTSDLCSVDPACFGEIRGEMATGDDLSTQIDVGPADAIEGRLGALLDHLDQQAPSGGWDAYWSRSTGIDWSNIVVAGFREGAGYAAWFARDHRTRSALLMSGPQDRGPIGTPAPWLTPGATPSCEMWAVYHAFETGDPATYQQTWNALGITDSASPLINPYPWRGDAHLGVVGGMSAGAEPWCQPIDVVADDACFDVSENFAPYAHLLCLIDEDPTVCP